MFPYCFLLLGFLYVEVAPKIPRPLIAWSIFSTISRLFFSGTSLRAGLHARIRTELFSSLTLASFQSRSQDLSKPAILRPFLSHKKNLSIRIRELVFLSIQNITYTPPKFNSSPLKNGAWKTILSYWGPVAFQGLC